MNFRAFLPRAAAAALLACTLLPAPALRADAAPVELKKWPKNDPLDAVLTKDERALYKTLADDAQRRKFIDFVYARRSSEGHDFHDFMAAALKVTHEYAIFKMEDHGGDEDDARASAPASVPAAEDHRKALYQSWETEIGKTMIGFGLPDHLGDDPKDSHYLLLTYSRGLPGNLPSPFIIRFFKASVPLMGDPKPYTMYQRSGKLPADSIWALILPSADSAWQAYQADPKAVRLKDCIALAPGVCAKAPPAGTTTVSGNGGEEASAGDAAPGAVAAGGKLADPEFATQYPGEGTLPLNITVNTLPTQKAGDTEVRLIISLPGGPFDAQAHLLPLEGSTGGEQEFINPAPGAKNSEPVFQGLDIRGVHYVEARRAVTAGQYRLAVVATRGADFGRAVQTLIIPRFDDGKLTATRVIFADQFEKAKAGEPFTLGDIRLLPHSGNFKTGDSFSAFVVAYGGLKMPGYKFSAELVCHVEFGVDGKSKHHIDFGKTGIQEAVCGKTTASSPLIGFTDIKVIAPPQPTVTVQGEVIKLRTKLFKVKVKITDENMQSSTETDWIPLPLEK